MSLAEAKSQVRQFLTTRYLADPEHSPAAAREEVVNIDVLAGDLESESD